MNNSNTSDEVDKPITETKIEESLLNHENSNEEENKLDPKENAVERDETTKTETLELETNDSSTVTNRISEINDCEPAFTGDENLSNDNNPTTEDSNNETLSTRRNDNGIEDFLMSIEEHHVPEVRWSWETHILNTHEITIDGDANNQHDRHHLDDAELNAYVSTRTLHSIDEDNYDDYTPEEITYNHLLPRNRNRTFRRSSIVNEIEFVSHSSTGNYRNQYLHRRVQQNQGSVNPPYNENHSLVPSFIYNHPRVQQLFNNLGVRLVNRNVEIPDNVLLNFNYNSEVNNIIYVPELNVYRNSMLNALANENILMEELYRANRRLNEIHDQQMLDELNNEPVNAVADVIEEIDPIPIQELVPVQPQPQQLPFEQLILIANGAITPLNGQHNAIIELIQSNPNLLFLNIRNIILIAHPDILIVGRNVVFSQSHHWVSVTELLRLRPVILNYERDNNNNGNQGFNRESDPSNERGRNQ